jgi:hypothetical protein
MRTSITLLLCRDTDVELSLEADKYPMKQSTTSNHSPFPVLAPFIEAARPCAFVDLSGVRYDLCRVIMERKKEYHQVEPGLTLYDIDREVRYPSGQHRHHTKWSGASIDVRNQHRAISQLTRVFEWI